MTTLEQRIEVLELEITELRERVRLDATAERFLAGDHEIRTGDFFIKYKGSEPSRLSYITSDGKWCYGSTEYGDRDQQRRHARLYTIAEVAEILARALRSEATR